MFERARIIVNPVAGRGRAVEGAAELREHLHALGIATDVHPTTHRRHAVELAASARADGCDVVVAVGGDGTVHEVLRGIFPDGPALAVLAAGTGNSLTVSWHLPDDPGILARKIAAGETLPIRPGLAGDQPFLCCAGVGLDAAMVRRFEAARRGGRAGRHRWIVPVLGTALALPRFDLRVRTDDGRTLDGLHEVLVTRVAVHGGVFRLPCTPEADATELDVLCFRARTRAGWLRTAWRGHRGELRVGTDVESVRARAVFVTSLAGEAPLQVDGDAAGATPVAIRLAGATLGLVGATAPRPIAALR